MTHHHDQHEHEHEPLPGTRDAELAECPVMPGSTVVKTDAEAAGLTREWAGTSYYLCCASCAPQWDADPTRYATA